MCVNGSIKMCDSGSVGNSPIRGKSAIKVRSWLISGKVFVRGNNAGKYWIRGNYAVCAWPYAPELYTLVHKLKNWVYRLSHNFFHYKNKSVLSYFIRQLDIYLSQRKNLFNLTKLNFSIKVIGSTINYSSITARNSCSWCRRSMR